MKKVLALSLVAVVALVSGVLYGSSAQAQTTPTTTTTTTSNQSVRCSISQARLNTRITQVDKTKEVQLKLYADLQTKVADFISSAEAAEYDTTKLIAANKAVSTALDAYKTKATDYATSLMATKNLSCGESDTAFTTSVTASRKALTDTRTATLAVRTAFKDQVIPALHDYATWLKTNAATEEKK